MTESDWNRSQAKQLMHDHMFKGTPLPDIVIDSVLHIFLARVGPANDGLLMTRAQIMMAGEVDANEANKELYREAYKRIQRAMKDHAQRIGMGRHGGTDATRTTTTESRGKRRTDREHDRESDRLFGSGFEHSTRSADGVRSSGDAQSERDSRSLPKQTIRKANHGGDSPRRSVTKTRTRAAVQSATKKTALVKRKRNTVTPKRKR